MITYTTEVYQKKVHGDNYKDAYKKAVKWLATNIISNDELSNEVTYNIVKDKKRPSVTIKFYSGLNEKELEEKHCRICKEMHASFFINQEVNCGWCNTKSYQNRMCDTMNVKASHMKGVLKKIDVK